MTLDWDAINKIQVGMGAVLMLAVLFLLLLLWVWHRESNNRVDLKDLVCKDGHLEIGRAHV